MNKVQMERTVQWNIDRDNCIGTKEVELRIFSEEVREFWEATTLVDRVDAYCDAQFVGVGTNFKLGNHDVMDTLITDSLNAMLCFMMLNDFNPTNQEQEDAVFRLLDDCYQEVLLANELKPKEKVNGKIIKGNKWYDPKTNIGFLLDQFFLNKGELSLI